ncbi:pimeloyl-ACP methyl ester carboxylesterase [Marmoricola sp. OAE513]|uniref:alpha/beta hydrolase family protein n=1 Tax=Marmoricola sp. OAE513 TaxID=2817894 RepID=UPI001AE881C8
MALVATNGIRLEVHEHGTGPAVLLLHGFPGTSYSWRHQIGPLADAGYRAVAVDLRGYGASDRPEAAYHDSSVIEADLIGVLDALGIERAHVVGQDFGSMYAWNLAQQHPDRVRSVLGTVPHGGEPGPVAPSVGFAAVAARHFLHLHYFQEQGLAERDLGGPHLAEFLRRLIWALSAGGDLLSVFGHPSAGTSYLDALPPTPPLPWSWLAQDELDTITSSFAAGGPGRELAGGLQAYRAADADWALARQRAGTPIGQPSLLVMGEHDPVRSFAPPDLEQQRTWLTGLQDVVLVPQAGHFVQQEQPAAFNDVLLRWLSR